MPRHRAEPKSKSDGRAAPKSVRRAAAARTRGAPATPAGLTHLGRDGSARMVDVGDKPVTRRRAVAEARVRISPELARRIRANELAKGNLLETARLAGIQAAKRTDELIPLCHALPVDAVDLRAVLRKGEIHLRSEVRVEARTGVEMEALVAVTVAALTAIDMGKSVDRAMEIVGVRLLEKEGGRSGRYLAPKSRSPRR